MLDGLRECYRILDVEPGASLEEVKRSYRELVKVWHPDRFTNDPSLQAKAQEKLKQINLAYERICKGETAESSGRTTTASPHSTGGEQQRGPSSSQESQRQAPGNPPPPRPEPSQPEANQKHPAPQPGTEAQWSYAAFGFGFLALSLWLAPTLTDDFSKYEAGEGIRTTRNMFLLYQLFGKQGVGVFFLLFGCFMGYVGLCHARALLSGQSLIRFGLKKGHLITAAVILGFFVLTGDRPRRPTAQSQPAYTLATPAYPVQPTPIAQPTPDAQFVPRQAVASPASPVPESREAAQIPAPPPKPDSVTHPGTPFEKSKTAELALAKEPRKTAEAQFERGKVLLDGEGVTKDEIEAFNWFRKAAEQGHAEAQFKLGIAYEDGRGGVPKDTVEAYKWLLLSGAQGFEWAGRNYLRLEGQITSSQREEGQRHAREFKPSAGEQSPMSDLLAKAERGDAEAQLELGMAFFAGQGVPKHDAEATNWFRKAAKQCHAEAQFKLGIAYEDGRGGLPKDAVEAYKWLLLSRAQGFEWAGRNCLRLEGQITSSQREEGQRRAREFQAAATKTAQRNAILGEDERAANEALLKLGLAYELGQGVPKNDTEAVIRFRKAAEQGDARAQFHLGTMYARGGGVPENELEAVKWFRNSAKQGNSDAQYNLGFAYDNGKGVPKDEVEAYKWFLLAGEHDQLVKLNLRRLEQEISSAQREEGQRRAREFKVVKQ